MPANDSEKAEDVPLFGGYLHVERCTNASEGWRVDDGYKWRVPTRCQGFFGRMMGLWMDTLPIEREIRRIAREEREWGYGGVHEGAQRWEENPTPPPPPSAQELAEQPQRVQFVTRNGTVISKSVGPTPSGPVPSL